MTRRTLRFGVLIGLIGGGMMALFAMMTMKMLGKGFFTPVNLFAHTFWRGAPLDGTFTLAAFELGLAIHLVVSITIGTLIAAIVESGQLDAGIIFLLALGIGVSAWVIQGLAWPVVDSAAHATFTPWVLAVGHLVFALGAAYFLLWLKQHDEPVGDPAVVVATSNAPTGQVVAPRATRSGFTRSVGDRQQPHSVEDPDLSETFGRGSQEPALTCRSAGDD